MAYKNDRESFLCEIKPIEFQNSTCDFEHDVFSDDLSSSSSIPTTEQSLIASKIAAIPKGDIVSVQILDGKFIFICKKRQELHWFMLMEDELESREDMKTLKKLGTIRLPPMTKVFTDQRQNLIIQNDQSITLNSKPTCPASTSSFKILNCLKCQALDNPFCSQFDGNIGGESGECVMQNNENSDDCGRFDIYSSAKTLNRSGFVIGSDKVFLEPVSLHIDQSEYYQALAEVDIPLVNHKWIISMPSDVKNVDDSFIGNSIGIESSIVNIGDCSIDDINVNLEFYFGDQLISNENFRIQNDCKDLREIEPVTKEPIIQNKSETILPKMDSMVEQETVTSTLTTTITTTTSFVSTTATTSTSTKTISTSKNTTTSSPSSPIENFKYEDLTNVTINLGGSSVGAVDPTSVAKTGAAFWTVVVAFACLLVGLGIGFRLGKKKYKKYQPGTKTESFGGI